MMQAFFAFLAAITMASMATAAVFNIPTPEVSKQGRTMLQRLTGLQDNVQLPGRVAILVNERDVAQMLQRGDLIRAHSNDFGLRQITIGSAAQKPGIVQESVRLDDDNNGAHPLTTVGNMIHKIIRRTRPSLPSFVGEPTQGQVMPIIVTVPASAMQNFMARAFGFARALGDPSILVEESETLEQEVPQPIIGSKIVHKNVPARPTVVEELEELTQEQKMPIIRKVPAKTPSSMARAIALARALEKPAAIVQETMEEEVQPPMTLKVTRKDGPSRPTVVKEDELEELMGEQKMPIIRRVPAKAARSFSGADASKLQQLVEQLLSANL